MWIRLEKKTKKKYTFYGSLLQAIVATGTNFQLVFGPGTWGFSSDANRDCDFDKEPGKV